MNKNKAINKKSVIYQAKNGAIELRGDFSHETIWVTQNQITEIFDIDQSVASRHIKNAFKEGEIDEKSNMQKMHIANSDRPVTFYSLDVVLSVGYRTNSKIAIEFRKWATKTLRDHITKGYTINRKRITHNYDGFIKAVSDIQALLPGHVTLDPKVMIDLVKEFASTWVSLDAYDKDELTKIGATKKAIELSGSELVEAIGKLRVELIAKNEATDIFAQERQAGSVVGIVGNVMQAFGGNALYPTIEEKAAHLLYFMVKNHPFVDGNKRSGAYAFVWFLRKARVLDLSKMTPPALTAITLLIAESDPAHKEKMTRLVLQLLKK